MCADNIFCSALKKCAFWFGLIALSLLVMARPAQAVVEQVDPTTPEKWEVLDGSYKNPATTPAASCAAYLTASWLPYFPGYSVASPVFVSAAQYRCRAVSPTGVFYINLPYVNRRIVAVCPVATPPYTYSVTSGKCERTMPDCPARGTTVSSGIYDIGTNPDSLSLAIFDGCTNSCGTILGYMNPVDWRAKISGVYHYYARGEIVYSGYACVEGAPTVPSTTDLTALVQSCASGEVGVTSSTGVLNCYKDGSISGASAPIAITTSTGTTVTTDPVTGASSVSEITTISQTTGGTSAAIPGVPADLQDFCQREPSSELCKPEGQDFGTVEDSDLGNKTVNVAINPVSVGGAGSCPAPSPMVLHGQTYFFEWTTYCNFANGIKPILLAFAWLSAAGLLVGGFRT